MLGFLLRIKENIFEPDKSTGMQTIHMPAKKYFS